MTEPIDESPERDSNYGRTESMPESTTEQVALNADEKVQGSSESVVDLTASSPEKRFGRRQAPTPEDSESYLPAMRFLKPGRKTDEAGDVERNQREVLHRLFQQFSVKAEIVRWTKGSRVTRFEIELGRGTRIDSITRLKDEIRYALGVTKVNILAPIPGQSYVGIEVPQDVPDIVSLKDLLNTEEAREISSEQVPLLIPIGEGVDGKAVLDDLGDMPHLLVAGSTGSGKSCFINSLICSLLVRTTPEQVRLVLIDPKRVEFSQFQNVPHLALPVITEVSDAAEALAWAVNEMEKRFSVLERLRITHVSKYNDRPKSMFEMYPNDPKQLPRIVIVIDELADLTDQKDRTMSDSIARLCAKGRAAGIHFILATQRPSVDVVTGVIKANIPKRIAFATATQVDSTVILDAPGAEELAGEGDGIFQRGGIKARVRFQGAYVDEDEIRSIVDYVIENAEKPDLQFGWKFNQALDAKLNSEDSGQDYSSQTSRLEMSDNLQAIESSDETIVKDSSAEVGISGRALMRSDGFGIEIADLPDAEVSDSSKSEHEVLQMPEFSEQDWHEILDLLEKRIEPCDITGEIVKQSQKRHVWRSLLSSYAKIKVRLVQHLVDRAEHRFRDRIEQDDAVTKLQKSLQEWTAEHSESIAWRFHERAIAEHRLAKELRAQAIERINSKVSFRNLNADQTYRDFVKAIMIPPVFSAYVYSVLVLTDKKFHFALKYFPPFNQGLFILGVIIFGMASIFVLKGIWKYTTAVRETQWAFIQAKKAYDDAVRTITHAYREEVRLEQQLVNIEPLFEVLAQGYKCRWQIDDRLEVDVFTHLNTENLPACVGFARAVQGPDDQVAKLQDLALRQVVKPGWRTEIVQMLGREFGDKNRTILNFEILDRDFGSSVAGAKNRFLEAFQDIELSKRIGSSKLYELVNIIHQSVLRNRNTDLRPPVKSTRVNGFEEIDTSSAWLTELDNNLNWVEYMAEILQEAPPFSVLNLTNVGKGKSINDNSVQSFAVIPQYMIGQNHSSVNVESNLPDLIAPVDVTVRVDVSDWGTLDSFVIFEQEESQENIDGAVVPENMGGFHGI